MKRVHRCALALVSAFAFCHFVAAEQHNFCDTDLSTPLDAYFCSEQKLAASNIRLAKLLATTLEILPNRVSPGVLPITKGQLKIEQVAWSIFVKKHCALVSQMPGQASDWHYSAAKENFCRVAESNIRITYLEKLHTCAIDGGGVCLP